MARSTESVKSNIGFFKLGVLLEDVHVLPSTMLNKWHYSVINIKTDKIACVKWWINYIIQLLTLKDKIACVKWWINYIIRLLTLKHIK